VVAQQQLWQLAEQLDIMRQWLWLERSSTLAYAKPETSNLHITGINGNSVTGLTREGGFTLKLWVKNDYVL